MLKAVVLYPTSISVRFY